MTSLRNELSELENLISKVGPGGTQKRRTTKHTHPKNSSTKPTHSTKPSYLDELEKIDSDPLSTKRKSRCALCKLTSFRVIISMIIFLIAGGLFVVFSEPGIYLQEPEIGEDTSEKSVTEPSEPNVVASILQNTFGLDTSDTSKNVNGQETNLLMTTYFVHQRDPLGHRQMTYNKTLLLEFIQNVDSFISNCHIVIFIDWRFDVGEDLPIEFHRVDFTDVRYTIHEYRFFLFEAYIQSHKSFQQILMVDFKDVKYGRDPFEFFQKSEKKIFVGSQGRLHSTRYLPYMKRKFGNCYPGGKTNGSIAAQKVIDMLQKEPEKYFYTNDGILGGERSYVEKILKDMISMMKEIPGVLFDRCNSNMLAFATIIYPYHENQVVFTGAPLHSPWRQRLSPSPDHDYVIFHK